jgi:hypothetical protein
MNKKSFIQMLGLHVNDPFFKRIFKTKGEYLKEGYVIASDVYSRVIEELQSEFKKIVSEFEETSSEKKKIIDELIFIIGELRKEEPSDKKNELIIVFEDCINLFGKEIKSFSTDHMKNLPLDKNYTDWRYVYGITEKH